MLNRYTQVLFLASISVSVSFFSCEEKKKTIKPTIITFKKEGELKLMNAANDSVVASLDIEIADTEFETQTGLMYRESMKGNRGMLFIFPNSKPRFFYMKNTRISLDLIYLDTKNKIVSFQENAKPFDESSLPSNAAAKYVLEVNAGLVQKWNLSVGDYMTFNKSN